MGWTDSISVILARVPLEKYLLRAPKEVDPWERLEKIIRKGTAVPAEPIAQRLQPKAFSIRL